MDDLRPEIHEAFADQQSKLGNLADSRERLVRGALAARNVHREGRTQLAAGVAALVIAALVIATFAYVRNGVGATRHGPPVPASSPTPLSRPLSVSNDTPVILYSDPVNEAQVDGITWDGKQKGKVAWPAKQATANPPANLFATAAEIRDRSGAVVATGNFYGKSFIGTWADDGQHFCLMVPAGLPGPSGVPAILQLVLPGQAPRTVAQVGRMYEQVITKVFACSVRKDRAVVFQSFGNSPAAAQYWVVQLSTGKVLWTHTFNPSSATLVVASPDGEYISETSVAQANPGSAIYSADGTHLAQLSASVDAFCWDGSLAVTNGGNVSQPVTVVAWRSGNVLWSGPAGYILSRVEPQPDGSSLAIWISAPTQLTYASGPHADLYVIASDGHVIAHVRDTTSYLISAPALSPG
jgi:hypothetical protein